MVSLEFNHLIPLHLHKGMAADDAVWHQWSNARTAELRQAIALLCGVDSDSLTLKEARSVNYIEWRLARGAAIVDANAHSQSTQVRQPGPR